MHKTGEIGVGIGSTYIIMIFVVLCLTTFGALALVTVDGDYKLTKKTGESTTNFYEADSKAEEILAQIDEVLIKSGQEVGEVSSQVGNKTEKQIGNKAGKHIEPLIDEEGIYKTYITKELEQITDFKIVSNENQRLEVSYQVRVDERQSLGVKVQINSYEMSKKSRYTLVEWALRSEADWEYEEIEFEDIIIGQ